MAEIKASDRLTTSVSNGLGSSMPKLSMIQKSRKTLSAMSSATIWFEVSAEASSPVPTTVAPNSSGPR